MKEQLIEWLVGKGVQGIAEPHFVFGTAMGAWGWLFLLLAGIAVPVFFARRMRSLPRQIRTAIIALRTGIILIALFLLLDPGLEGFRFNPQENYVLLLFDNSASMAIAPQDQPNRGKRLKAAYQAAFAEFEEPLSRNFQLARYAFGEGVQRISSLDDLSFDGSESSIQKAVTSALNDFQGISVSAVIVFSDGIEQPALEKLALTSEVPVFTVLVGDASHFQDLELGEVSYTRNSGKNAPVSVNLAFNATGLKGYQAQAQIRKNNQTLASKTVMIGKDEEQDMVRLTFSPKDEGWQAYEVRLDIAGLGPSRAIARDQIAQNNSATVLIDNRSKEFRVFYFCGRPNWENKFVQQALKEDEEILLTNVLRISAAETKFVYRGKFTSMSNPLFEGFFQDEFDQPRYDESVFLRFGGTRELAGRGFPETAAELYDQDLLVIGEVEAQFFSQAQLELIREFVRKRGGALLLLGGPHSFNEGNYQNTVLTGILPVILEKTKAKDQPVSFSRFQVNPTMEGFHEGTWTLNPNATQNQELWRGLPDLAGLNTFAMTRPHVTVAAETQSSESVADGLPLFASVRFGEGKTAVLATGSTWQWRLGTSPEDGSHSQFWRQLVRNLAGDVPKPISLRHKRDQYERNKDVTLDVFIRDALFNERPGLQTRLILKAPDGRTIQPGVEESIEEAGIYRIRFQPQQAGVYQINLSAQDAMGTSVGTLEEAILVADDQREFRRASVNPVFLEKLAQATGGKSFLLNELNDVAVQIPFRHHEQAERVRLPFWFFPPFFVLLVLGLSVEWYLRRTRGLA